MVLNAFDAGKSRSPLGGAEQDSTNYSVQQVSLHMVFVAFDPRARPKAQ
jgi:hypothetical protein